MAAGKLITLTGGALSKNIVWVVSGASTFGAGSGWQGIILDKTSVTFQTGATLNGQIYAQTSVALQKAIITQT